MHSVLFAVITDYNQMPMNSELTFHFFEGLNLFEVEAELAEAAAASTIFIREALRVFSNSLICSYL